VIGRSEPAPSIMVRIEEALPMKRFLFPAGFATALALSAPGLAEPVMLVPDAGLQVERDSVRLGASSDEWFFGDGGFGCPLWWCGDQGVRVGVAPQRAPRPDPSDFWFFGDGGFGWRQRR
jgi:hypothetical protein